MKAIVFAVALTCALTWCNVEANIGSPSPSPFPSPSPSPNPSATVDPALEQLCLGTEFPADCMKTELKYLNGEPVSARSMLVAGLKILSDRAANAIKNCEQIKKNQPSSGALAGAVDVCIANYNNIANSAKRAFDAFSKGSDAMLELELDDAVTSIFRCSDMFRDPKESPLFDTNLQLHMAAKNNINIANLIETSA